MNSRNNGKQQCSSSQRSPFKTDGAARRERGPLLLPYSTFQLLHALVERSLRGSLQRQLHTDTGSRMFLAPAESSFRLTVQLLLNILEFRLIPPQARLIHTQVNAFWQHVIAYINIHIHFSHTFSEWHIYSSMCHTSIHLSASFCFLLSDTLCWFCCYLQKLRVLWLLLLVSLLASTHSIYFISPQLQ